MRYLVKARPKLEKQGELRESVEDGSIGTGSVAFGEYEKNMKEARLLEDGTVTWVEVCYCATPLEEEMPYWEEYFEMGKITDAHARRNCRHENGSEPWACSNCDCTEKLEAKLSEQGVGFLNSLQENSGQE